MLYGKAGGDLLYKLKRLVYIILIFTILLAIIFTSLLVIYDGNMRRIINNYSASAAQVKVNSILNSKVYDFLDKSALSYSDLVDITYDDNLDVKSIKVDTVKVNKLKSGVVSSIQNEIANKEKYNINIPLGTIIGNSFTINKGPAIPIEMQMSSAVHSDVISSFEGSGINQTLHRIILRIEINIYILLPWYRANSTIETDFILTETVIVGKIPDAFTVVIETEEDNTGGLINDYGANNYN